MRNSCKFAKRILVFASSAKISEGTWRKLCSDVIEPVLLDISNDAKTLVIDGERHNAYSDSIPVGEQSDWFAENVTPEMAYELFLAQREYESVARSYDKLLSEPPYETASEVAERLSNGVSQTDEINRFLVLADTFVETADEFLDDIKPELISSLLCLAMNIYTHCMLLAPLDFDTSITLCGDITKRCTEQRRKIEKLGTGQHIDAESAAEETPSEETSEENAPAEEESSAEEEASAEDEALAGPSPETETNTTKEDEDGFEFVAKAAEKVSFGDISTDFDAANIST